MQTRSYSTFCPSRSHPVLCSMDLDLLIHAGPETGFNLEGLFDNRDYPERSPS